MAEWKREQRHTELERRQAVEEVDEAELEELEERDVSTDPGEYEEVPASGAYITAKEPKDGYQYYYWQWRDGDSWKNKYIAPVNPKRD